MRIKETQMLLNWLRPEYALQYLYKSGIKLKQITRVGFKINSNLNVIKYKRTQTKQCKSQLKNGSIIIQLDRRFRNKPE